MLWQRARGNRTPISSTSGPRLLAGILLLLCCSQRAGAYRWGQTGVTSNLVLCRGKVIFTQADSTLTALDIETGEVRARLTDEAYWGKLTAAPEGLFIQRYDRFLMLAPDSLEVVRDRSDIVQSQYAEGLLLYQDNRGQFTCEELRTGKKQWSFACYSHRLVIVALGKAVLLYCPGYDGQCEPIVIVVDLESGTERFRRGPDEGRHYLSAHLEDDRVLILEGPYPSKVEPILGGGRSRAVLERIYELDLSGNLVAEHEAPEELRGRENVDLPLPLARGIPLNGRLVHLFSTEHPYWVHDHFGHKQHEPVYRHRWWSMGAQNVFSASRGWVTTYAVSLGRNSAGSLPRHPTLINAEIGDAQWWGLIPLARHKCDVLVSAAVFNERLVLGTRYGQVACLDARTGDQHWLYLSPTIRSTISSCSAAPGPNLAGHARSHRKLNTDPMRALGVLTLPDEFRPGSEEALRHMEAALREATPPPRVTKDPRPSNPFAYVGWWIALAWTVAIAPIAASVLVERSRRRIHLRAGHVTMIEALLIVLTAHLWLRLGGIATGPSWVMQGTVVVGWPVLLMRSLILIARKEYLFPLTTILWLLGIAVLAGLNLGIL